MRHLLVVRRQRAALLAVDSTKRTREPRWTGVRDTYIVFKVVVDGIIGGEALRGAFSREGGVAEVRGLRVLGANGEGGFRALCAGGTIVGIEIVVSTVGVEVCVRVVGADIVVVALEARGGAVADVVGVALEIQVLLVDIRIRQEWLICDLLTSKVIGSDGGTSS
ncbi:hypothetical protein PMIN03_001873 [Paraphaeosphaeria minitans]